MSQIIKLDSISACKKVYNDIERHSLSISRVIDLLNECSCLWKEDGEFYQRAQKYLDENNILSKEMDIKALDLISNLITKESLVKRVKNEFGSLGVLDDFQSTKGYAGKTKYESLGKVLHVTAGNVFLGAIDSLIMGVLTKNQNIVKLSTKNQFIPNLFLESIKRVDKKSELFRSIKLVSFTGGNIEIESFFKNHMDGIIAWGGEDMVLNYQKGLSPKVKLITHGPKISFHVIDYDYLKNYESDIYNQIAKDIGMWNQQACANSQNIFLSETINYNEFSEKLLFAMENTFARNDLNSDEWVDKHKERFLGLFSEFLSGFKVQNSDENLITFESSELAPTSLNNSVKIKFFSDDNDLFDKIYRLKFYLQTCGLGASGQRRSELRRVLAGAGVTRFTRPGAMLESIDGSGHDGSLPLHELVNIVNDEAIEDTRDFLDQVNVKFYENLNSNNLNEFPIIDGKTLQQNSLIKNSNLYDSSFNSGYIYSSGGTSGSPKYSFYSYEEFENVCVLLAKSYKINGIRPGTRVANLFMAGNMWSSFNAIQKALEVCETIQFPIGGLVSPKDFETYINSFNIKCVFGIPSLLLELANNSNELEIEQVFYAGEILTFETRKFLEKKWGCKEFISAGYACVDVGPIGYQDKSCKGSEHILFDELIELEVVNEEAVVTSKVRKSMPVIRYRTGDKIKIISQDGSGIKFKLLGRVDQKINIWGARFELEEVKAVIEQDFQIILNTETIKDKLFDTITIKIQNKPEENFKEQLFLTMKDVRDTVVYEDFCRRVKIEKSSFLKNSKTGKFKIINDLRL